MKSNDRLDALRVLTQVIKHQVSLSHVMQNKPLSPLSKEICYGVCRYYFRLHAIAQHFLKKLPKTLEIRILLLIGLYQIHYMRTPNYAVVKETVHLLDAIKHAWAKGLVNAVLRNYCKQEEALPPGLTEQEAYQYNHPHWFLQALKLAWPHEWLAIMHANDERPPMSLRVNRLQSSVEAYLDRLNQQGINAHKQPFSSDGIELFIPQDVKELPGFLEGELSVQDEAAQLAAGLLELKPKMRLLDACCAPGGKTAHCLETQPHLSECVALDVDAQRLSKVKENLERLKLSATLIHADALEPQTWWDGQPFDRILLDAPCSATGVIRRHPDIKILREKEQIATLAALQKKLLHTLWPLLKPQGILVYATCSIMPEENEQQIAQFVSTNTSAQVVMKTESWGIATLHGRQILPGQHNMDGFFYSVLKKSHT